MPFGFEGIPFHQTTLSQILGKRIPVIVNVFHPRSKLRRHTPYTDIQITLLLGHVPRVARQAVPEEP